MFRPPRTINDLPDELLFHIGAQFTHLNRNWDLANLALVSRRWRPVTQEWLLKEPRFNLTYIDQYMWELGHRPHLLRQVRSLEIWSTSEGRIQRDERGLLERVYTPTPAPDTENWNVEFVERCAAVIKQHANGSKDKERWTNALHDDVVPALFGVLVCTLPNLRELKLGEGWLLDFPVFASILSPTVKTSITIPRDWKHTYLAWPFRQVASRLAVLEVPADMSTMLFSVRRACGAILDFRPFAQLKVLSVTMKALWWFEHRCAPSDPREVFPPTLELLRISEATSCTARVLDDLCVAKKGGHYPALRRVEVYHMNHFEDSEAEADLWHCPHPVDDVQRMFRDTEVELYMYFPPWGMKTWEAGGTPWNLKTEGNALRRGEQMCYRKSMGAFAVCEEETLRFEAEWDADGDAVMI